MTEIRTKIRGFIEAQLLFGTGPLGLSDEDSLIAHHVLDSTGILELVLFLEAEFGVHVRDEEFVPENLDGIAKLERFILARCA
jgi:acyl carrier protein